MEKLAKLSLIYLKMKICYKEHVKVKRLRDPSNERIMVPLEMGKLKVFHSLKNKSTKIFDKTG